MPYGFLIHNSSFIIQSMPLSQSIINRTLSSSHGEQAYKLVETLLDAGYEAWWVGGCTRDMLQEIIPKDIDITTNATPIQLSKVFEKIDMTNANLGSVLISINGHTFEVTTFREETEESNGRHPDSVTFSTIEEDAKRRDITINAMYWNPISSKLYDPFEGERDSNEKLIRFIGDPHIRIQHDALRLLRAIRFRSFINGQYHPETFSALHELATQAKILSGYRVFQELEKMLLGKHPEVALEDLWETGVLEQVIPELYACKGVAQPSVFHEEGDVWNHLIQIVSSYTDDHLIDVRWAAMMHDIGKPPTFSIENDRIHFNEHASIGAKIASEVLSRLQCPAKRKEKISWLIAHHMMIGDFLKLSDERKAHWYYHPWFVELLQIFWLDIKGSTPSDFALYDKIIQDYNKYLDANPRPKEPLLTGEEIMEMTGLAPGEGVGKILKALYEAQIANKVTTKKEAKDFIATIQN